MGISGERMQCFAARHPCAPFACCLDLDYCWGHPEQVAAAPWFEYGEQQSQLVNKRNEWHIASNCMGGAGLFINIMLFVLYLLCWRWAAATYLLACTAPKGAVHTYLLYFHRPATRRYFLYFSSTTGKDIYFFLVQEVCVCGGGGRFRRVD